MGETPDQIAEAITEHWGERCDDFEPTCWCCKAWAQYDALKAAPAVERERCAKIADDHAKAWGLAHSTPAIVIATAIRTGVEDQNSSTKLRG